MLIDTIVKVVLEILFGGGLHPGVFLILPHEALEKALGSLVALWVVSEGPDSLQVAVDYLNDIDRSQLDSWLLVSA